MNRFQLISRAIVVIFTIAAIPHVFASLTATNKENKPAKANASTPDQSFLGKWRVKIQNTELVATYELKQEGKQIKGYMTKVTDKQGNAYNDYSLVLDIRQPQSMTGFYQMKYEGKLYKMPCKLKLLDSQRIKIEYTYEGHSLNEIWTKLSL